MEGNRLLVVMHGSKRKHCVVAYYPQCPSRRSCRELLMVEGMHCLRERIDFYLRHRTITERLDNFLDVIFNFSIVSFSPP